MPAAAPQSEEPLIGNLVQRMLDRDEHTRDTLFQVASQLGALNSAVSGNQQELSRLVKLQEEQAEYNRRQIELGERSQQHQRALEDFIAESRKQGEKIDALRDVVSTYRGGLSTLQWVVGVSIGLVVALGVPLVGVVYSTIQRDIARIESQVAPASQKVNP